MRRIVAAGMKETARLCHPPTQNTGVVLAVTMPVIDMDELGQFAKLSTQFSAGW